MHRDILIIGAGQLGSRHLQGLARSDRTFHIDVVDTSQDSLNTARARFEEVVPAGTGQHTAAYHTSLVPGRSYDLAIIATSSGPRAAVTRELLSICQVGAIVFEKVLFTRLEDYSAIGELLKEQAIPAWVNCPRRMYPLYRELQAELRGPLQLMLQGGMWGLACNSIHFLDLVSFLSGENAFSWDISRLDPAIHKSSRHGYLEFSGTLAISSANGTRVTLHAQAESKAPMAMTILGLHASVIIDEANGKGWLYRETKGWKPEALEFRNPFQSELSHLLAEQIMDSGRCDLPGYEESATLHRGMMDAFQRHLLGLGQDARQCLIT